MVNPDFERIENYIAAVDWRMAKAGDHAYTIFSDNINRMDDALYFVQAIRDHGYGKRFAGKVYMYFDVGDFRYWTMGAPIDATILINRALNVSE